MWWILSLTGYVQQSDTEENSWNYLFSLIICEMSPFSLVALPELSFFVHGKCHKDNKYIPIRNFSVSSARGTTAQHPQQKLDQQGIGEKIVTSKGWRKQNDPRLWKNVIRLGCFCADRYVSKDELFVINFDFSLLWRWGPYFVNSDAVVSSVSSCRIFFLWNLPGVRWSQRRDVCKTSPEENSSTSICS